MTEPTWEGYDHCMDYWLIVPEVDRGDHVCICSSKTPTYGKGVPKGKWDVYFKKRLCIVDTEEEARAIAILQWHALVNAQVAEGE